MKEIVPRMYIVMADGWTLDVVGPEAQRLADNIGLRNLIFETVRVTGAFNAIHYLPVNQIVRMTLTFEEKVV